MKNDGLTPLHYAAQDGSLKNLKNIWYFDILKRKILFTGHEKIVELFLRNGAEFNVKILCTEDTPLHLAASGGKLDNLSDYYLGWTRNPNYMKKYKTSRYQAVKLGLAAFRLTIKSNCVLEMKSIFFFRPLSKCLFTLPSWIRSEYVE